jgi:hypothetical protein
VPVNPDCVDLDELRLLQQSPVPEKLDVFNRLSIHPMLALARIIVHCNARRFGTQLLEMMQEADRKAEKKSSTGKKKKTARPSHRGQ